MATLLIVPASHWLL